MSHKKFNVDAPTLTFDEVFQALKHWRSHKDDYEQRSIPHDIWLGIFKLESLGYTGSELCRLLTLNTDQFKKKRERLVENKTPSVSELAPPKSQSETPQEKADFCEAIVSSSETPQIPSLKVAANHTKKELSQLKSTNTKPESFLDLTTIIVECIRPDGHRLKIHTTNKSIDLVMQAFFKQEVID